MMGKALTGKLSWSVTGLVFVQIMLHHAISDDDSDADFLTYETEFVPFLAVMENSFLHTG